MHLKIKPFNSIVQDRYEHHGHFHDGDAGIDLFAIDKQAIRAGETAFIHLQISCENSENKPYLLMPRSSIAKTPLRLSNSIGLIDGGYRGEIMASVDNIKNKDYSVEPGQRLFQLVAMDGSPVHIEIVKHLTETTRGSGGFGSTGK